MKEIIKERIVKDVVGYEALDGKIFTDKTECEKYENTCSVVLLNHYNKLVVGNVCEYALFCGNGSEEYSYDIVVPKNYNDIDIINKVLVYFWGSNNCTQIDYDMIYKEILVLKDYDDVPTGYATTLDKILKEIASEYDKAKSKN